MGWDDHPQYKELSWSTLAHMMKLLKKLSQHWNLQGLQGPSLGKWEKFSRVEFRPRLRRYPRFSGKPMEWGTPRMDGGEMGVSLDAWKDALPSESQVGKL